MLRAVAKAEAVSFLLLLGVAMPLKYLAGWPLGVQVVGALHGGLFLLFCAALLRTMLVARWPIARAALLFLASLLPFGPFVLDGRMAGYQEEFARGLH